MDDSTLARKVKEEACNESLKLLIEKHSPLFYSIYKKYEPSLISSCINTADFLTEKDFLIYDSCNKFNPARKVKFSTYLANRIRWKCLNTINLKQKYIPINNKDLQYHVDKNQTADTRIEDGEDINYALSILNKIKDERIRTIFKMRYFDSRKNTPWRLISKKLNLSEQTIINLHAKGRKLLAEKLSS